MSLLNLIEPELTRLAQQVSEGRSLAEMASVFHRGWSELGRSLFEHQVQESIERVERE